MKKNSGGKRDGAGRPPAIWGKTVMVRVPPPLINEVRRLIADFKVKK